MKKLLNFVMLPLMAATIITYSLTYFIGYSQPVNMDMLDYAGTNITFALLGLFFGFIPCFIVAMAKHTLSQLRACNESEQAPEHQPAPANMYIIGQVITIPACNVIVRVKRVKTALQIIELSNPDLYDYL